jgi:predicted acetyltransferase
VLEFRKALPEDFPALAQMLELYQYELSEIWHQDLDEEGRYGYDLSPHKVDNTFCAYVATQNSVYIGFALVAPAAVTLKAGAWMEQFFVLKRHRGSGIGAAFARHVLTEHPGPWEVGQMPTNVAAQSFWRSVIGKLTAGEYIELQVTQGWWQGVVQQFRVPAAA